MLKILFVCMGNYCRSPLAQGVCESALRARGWHERVIVGSAGTHRDHQGSPPDPRAVNIAEKHQISIKHICSRQIIVQDFMTWDYIIAMDRNNLHRLQQKCPANLQGKLSLLMMHAKPAAMLDVPDPYWASDDRGFIEVFEMITKGITGLLDEITPVVDADYA